MYLLDSLDIKKKRATPSAHKELTGQKPISFNKRLTNRIEKVND
jgi:hypothetical protein